MTPASSIDRAAVAARRRVRSPPRSSVCWRASSPSPRHRLDPQRSGSPTLLDYAGERRRRRQPTETTAYGDRPPGADRGLPRRHRRSATGRCQSAIHTPAWCGWVARQALQARSTARRTPTTMFERLRARRSQTPGSQTRKGYYWAGRAAQACGRDMPPAPTVYYAAGARRHSDQYLRPARHRTGSERPVAIPPDPPKPRSRSPDAQRAAFEASEPVRVVRLLNRPRATGRIRPRSSAQIAQNARRRQEDHQLVGRSVAQRSCVGPISAVIASRAGARVGHAPIRSATGFPTIAGAARPMISTAGR